MNLEAKILKSMTGLSLPSYDLAEKALIGLLLLNANTHKETFERLRAYHMYQEDYKKVYGVMRSLYLAAKPVTMELIVRDLLHLKVKPYILSDCMGEVSKMPAGTLASQLVDVLINLHTQRKLMQLGNQLLYSASLPSSTLDLDKTLDRVNNTLKRVNNAHSALNFGDIEEIKYDPDFEAKKDPFFALNVSDDLDPNYFQNYNLVDEHCMIAVTGKEGSRKTHLMNDLKATFLGANSHIGFSYLRHKPKRILDIDTEQSKVEFHLGVRGVQERCPKSFYENMFAYSLATIDKNRRLDYLMHLVKKHKPEVLFLDGYVDFIVNYNDLTECSNFVTKLIQIREEYNCCIIGVLHLAKSTGLMRGHIGTFLAEKCALIMKCEIVEDNPQNTKLSCMKNRQGRRFPPLEFSHYLPKNINTPF